MDTVWRKRFEEILQDRAGVSLHRALWQVQRHGYLAGFGLENCSFEPQHQILSGLNALIEEASRTSIRRNRLIAVDDQGNYRLDILDDRLVDMIIDKLPLIVPRQKFELAATQLNNHLHAQQRTLKSPVAV